MKSNALLIVAWMLTGSSLGDDRVDFSRQVRPILASRCLKCHGRSDTTREAGLRLDRRPSAVATLPSGHQAVVPGKAMASALISRVASADPDLRMPPDGPPLSRQQVDLLSRWINQGADWGQHWAYVVPRRPVVPTNDNDPGAVNPIDRFIRHRLERERLVPSNEADKNRLCRRLYLDLTGLPPTL